MDLYLKVDIFLSVSPSLLSLVDISLTNNVSSLYFKRLWAQERRCYTGAWGILFTHLDHITVQNRNIMSVPTMMPVSAAPAFMRLISISCRFMCLSKSFLNVVIRSNFTPSQQHVLGIYHCVKLHALYIFKSLKSKPSIIWHFPLGEQILTNIFFLCLS